MCRAPTQIGRHIRLLSLGGPTKEAFVEPAAVGQPLPDMPLFLKSKFHVMVPLEKTYQSAWEAVPEYWRVVMMGAGDGFRVEFSSDAKVRQIRQSVILTESLSAFSGQESGTKKIGCGLA